MATEILMPALSPTMEEGKLAKWLVKEGQKVRSGDIIAEIETDKATMEVEAVDEGTVGSILIAEGTDKVEPAFSRFMLLAMNACGLPRHSATSIWSSETPERCVRPAMRDKESPGRTR